MDHTDPLDRAAEQLARTWQVAAVTVRGALTDLVAEGFTLTELDGPGTDRVHARAAQQHLVGTVAGLVTVQAPGAHTDRYTLDAHGRPTHVYYASYGSNLHAERFTAYLSGGTPTGSARTYLGCRDTAAATDDVPLALPGTVHYAGNSRVWSGGVAFLATGTVGRSLARAYRITLEQFEDVAAQESNHPVGSHHLDIAALMKAGQVHQPGTYGRLVHVGDLRGAPVLTFTGPFTPAQARAGTLVIDHRGHLVPAATTTTSPTTPPGGGPSPWAVYSAPPSPAYRSMIAAGLAETHHLTPHQVQVYLHGSTGAYRQP
jgi:hypothetical protein